ncbi:MAG: hypothetical protein ACR2OG_15290 [Gemmatimonadaceae bacterium]
MTDNEEQARRASSGNHPNDGCGDRKTSGDEDLRQRVRESADKVMKANREVLDRLATK